MVGGKVITETSATLNFTHTFTKKQSSAIFKTSGSILGTALGGMSKMMLLLPPNIAIPSTAILQTLSTATKTGSAIVARKKKGGAIYFYRLL